MNKSELEVMGYKFPNPMYDVFADGLRLIVDAPNNERIVKLVVDRDADIDAIMLEMARQHQRGEIALDDPPLKWPRDIN